MTTWSCMRTCAVDRSTTSEWDGADIDAVSEVERGVRVDAARFEQLHAVVRGALAASAVSVLEHIGRSAIRGTTVTSVWWHFKAWVSHF